MCGIVGYVGTQDAYPVLIGGLQRLEYRGYDSAGVATLVSDGKLEIRRAVGKLDQLRALVDHAPLAGHIGIGHTRWATHGKPSEENAHPHKAGPVAVIHNGIVENYLELRAGLIERGHKLRSETDTELISHLIEERLKDGRGLAEAVRAAVAELRGSFSIVVLSETEPGKLVAAKTEGEHLLTRVLADVLKVDPSRPGATSSAPPASLRAAVPDAENRVLIITHRVGRVVRIGRQPGKQKIDVSIPRLLDPEIAEVDLRFGKAVGQNERLGQPHLVDCVVTRVNESGVKIVHRVFGTIGLKGGFASLVPPAAQCLLLGMVSPHGESRDDKEDGQCHNADQDQGFPLQRPQESLRPRTDGTGCLAGRNQLPASWAKPITLWRHSLCFSPLASSTGWAAQALECGT